MGLSAALSAAAIAASVGGTLYSTSQQTSAANKAGAIQQQGADQSNALIKSMFDTTQANLKPFIDFGTQAGNKLFAGINDTGPNGLTSPVNPFFNPTMAQLEQTPGYQFTLGQGLKAVNNANSAKGWGLSGAGMKGIADYTTGLASQTYQQQFGNFQSQFANQWANKQNAYNMLINPLQFGAQAALGQGTIGTTVGGQLSANTIGGANAGASAALATGNANANAPFNALLNYQALQGLINNNSTGASASALFGNNPILSV